MASIDQQGPLIAIKGSFVFIYTFFLGLINTGLLLITSRNFQLNSRKYYIARFGGSYALGIVLIFAMHPFFSVVHNYWTNNPVTSGLFNVVRWKELCILSIMINSSIIAQQSLRVMNKERVNAELESSRLKTIHAEAANQLLRQQIQPHFLFNALSTLKSLYDLDKESGDEYLIRLSNFLRFNLTTSKADIIPLKEELKHCLDYLEMQKIRLDTALNFTYIISDEALEVGYLPVFALQPLLENAIKHNEITHEFPLNIQIEQKGDRIRVTNNLKLKKMPEESSGTGLFNLIERYQILSGDEVIILNNECEFSVSIKILKHANNNH